MNDAFQELFDRQRAARWSVAVTRPAERELKLRRLLDALQSRRTEAREALAADFRRAPADLELAELAPLCAELRHAIRHLEAWLRPERVPAPPALAGTRARIRHEPKGLALILSPWNYPLYLSLGPLASAIAAGDCAVLKPSEFAPHASAFLKDLLAGLFPPEEVAVVEGGPEAAEALLELPFDHLFFTGGPEAGRKVMAAAARNLASVTLELGGKSPVLVDADADLPRAARRIVWGKFLNAGQTCVAPDYVLAHAQVHARLVEELAQAVAAFFGATPEARRRSPDLARIVNDRHYHRLTGLLDRSGGELRLGGERDPAERYLAPTLVTGVAEDAPLMQEEIFGPILPVLEVPDLDAAVRFVNDRPKPLALYLFTRKAWTAEHVLARTSAGGSCVNDTLLQFIHPGLPAGGVNASGLGRAHGHAGFLAFTNARSVLRSPRWYSPARWFYPPWTGRSAWLARVAEKFL